MSLRCWFGHDPGAVVARGNRLHVRCTRCDRLSPGVAIDGPRPRVTPPLQPKARIWWLRAVYETKRAAQR